MSDTKQCRHCHETKPLTEFSRQADMADGYANRCKACKRAYNHMVRHELPKPEPAEVALGRLALRFQRVMAESFR